MKQAVKNPVIPEDDAKVIKKTFISATPELPNSMMSPKAVADAMSALEADTKLDEVTYKKRRYSLTKRDALLQERDQVGRGGWFNFGVPTTKLSLTPLSGGRIQLSMKNHREETVKCNLKDNNMYLAYDIQTALDIGEATNQNVQFHTSAFGSWNASEWFDQAYVTFTPKK
jgi:hypothetical protein